MVPSEPREIVCICYGNICRSPMMEALLQRALDDRFGPGAFMVTGAGIGADDGRPSSQGTLRALQRRGIDFRRHRSRFLTREILRDAWRVFAAEAYQIEHLHPALSADELVKARLFGGEEIPDPLGSGEEAYEAVATQIERLIPIVVAEITADLEDERSDSSGTHP